MMPYSCTVCEFKSATIIDIKHHMKSHSNVLLHQCTYCSKKFKRDCNLKEHIKAIHTKDSTGAAYICEICNFSTLRRSTLRSHMKTHNESYVECACPICGSTFKSKAIFKYHMLTHADVKYFCCNECDKTFTLATRLRAHERQVHGPRNFECIHCSKTFPTVHHLNRHNLTHTGDKPFSCSYCPHSSNTKGNISKHMLFIHGRSKEFFLINGKNGENFADFKKETANESEQFNFLSAKGKVIAEAYLEILSKKGLSDATLEKLKEKKKLEDYAKFMDLKKRLSNSEIGKNFPKQSIVMKGNKTKELKISENENVSSGIEEKPSNNDLGISPAIIAKPNNSEISPFHKNKTCSITPPTKNRKQRQMNCSSLSHNGQFVIDENGHLSPLSGGKLDKKTLKFHGEFISTFESSINAADSYSEFGHIDDKISSMDDKKPRIMTYNNNLKETCQPFYEDSFCSVKKIATRYVSNKEKLSIKKSKQALFHEAHNKLREQNKLKNYKKSSSTNFEMIETEYEKKGNPAYSSPNVEVFDLAQIKKHLHSENDESHRKSDSIHYDFKILSEDLFSIEQPDLGLTLDQPSGTCHNFDSNFKNLCLYLPQNSCLISRDFILSPEKSITDPVENSSSIFMINSYNCPSSTKGSLLDNLVSNRESGSSQEMLSELRIKKIGDDISAPDVIDYQEDTVNDVENIIITNKVNSSQNINDAFHLVSIAEVVGSSNPEVTIYISP